MSNPAIFAATTVATTAAAAAAAEQMRQEEENMTGYNKEDLDGWEFKIVRSAMQKFKNREVLQQLCQEEAQAGWEMVEKFDNSRIRFKRRVERRSNDHLVTIDPYRTRMSGDGSGTTIAIIIGVCVMILGGLLFAFLTFGR